MVQRKRLEKTSKTSKERKERRISHIGQARWAEVKMLGPESCIELLMKMVRADELRIYHGRKTDNTQTGIRLTLKRMFILFGCTDKRAIELVEYVMERDNV